MNEKAVSFWEDAVSIALWLTAFLLPVAFYLKTYDSALVKELTLQTTAALAAAFAALRHVEAGRFEMPANRVPLAALAAALLFWVGASFALNPHPEASLFGALRLAAFLTLFIVAFTGPASVSFAAALADWTVAAAALASSYAVSQALGTDPIAWKGTFGDRAFSTLIDPELLGVFLGAAFPVAMARASDPEAGTLRRNAARAAALLCILGTLAASSAAGFIALAVSAAAFAVLTLLLFREPVLRFAGLGAAALIPIIAATVARSGGEALTSGLAAAWTARVELWTNCLRLAAQTPWTGVGAGGFAAAARTAAARSEPLQLACELGLASVFLWCALLAAGLYLAYKDIGRRAAQGQLRAAAVMAGLWAGVAGLAAAGCVSGALREPAPGVFLWLFLGTLAGLALERGSAVVRVIPIPASASVRRSLYAPVAAAVCFTLVWQARFFSSDLAHNAGIYHAKRNDFEKALGAFARVSRWHESGVAARYFSANIQNERKGAGDPEAALAGYREVERMSPHFARVDYHKALAYRKLRDWEGAEAALRAAIRLDPRFPTAHYDLVEVLTIAGDKNAALAAALELVRIEPAEARHWRFLSEQYRARRNFKMARRMLERAERVHDLAEGGAKGPVGSGSRGGKS